MTEYEVIVGNVGLVYSGLSQDLAETAFETYVSLSREGIGHAAGEDVTLLRDGEPMKEHGGEQDETR